MKRMIKKQSKRTLALVVSFLLVMSCIIGIIPQVAGRAIWSDEQTDRPADSLVATYANHPTGTGDVNGTASSFTVRATVVNHAVSLSITTEGNLTGTTVYAAVMDYKSFADPNGPNGIVTNWADSARFSNPGGANVKDITDYRYNVTSNFATSGALTISSWTAASGATATLKPISITNNDASTAGMATNGDRNTNYYRSYIFIVMSGSIGGGQPTRYAYGTFIMDSQGNMLEGSYLVRYNKNATANYRTAAQAGVTGTIGNQQTPWAEPTTLRKDQYTRIGFDFKGWDTSAVFAHQWKANAATTTDAAYVYKPWSEIEADGPQPAYQPEGTLVPTAVAGLDKYDSVSLFAAWYPRQVQYAPTGTKTNVTITDKSAAKADLGNNRNSTADVSTLNVTVPMITLPSPQVGVGYTQSVPLGGTSDKTTGKSYQIVYGVKFKAADDGPEITSDNTLTRFGIGYNTRNDHAEVSSAAGGPTNHSDGANVHMLLKITDNANGTTDYLMIRFVEVKKGAQPAPTLDQNTGLQSRITEGTNPTNPEEKISDGQIFGFYSDGPMIQKSAGETSGDASGYFPTATNNTGTYGTGTMTSYYLNMGMVYEYRPQKITIDGAQVDLTAKWAAAEGDADPEAKQAAIDELKSMGFYYELNQGYREVPFPETWYSNAAQKTALTASLALNAKTVTTSTKNGNNSNAVVAAVSAVPAGFAGDEGTGWHSGYGWITFDTENAGDLHNARTSLPVIHGLTQDDVYQVRFRKNATREVSADREITIGGAAGGNNKTAEDFAAVIFFDWDETLLGSSVADGADAAGLAASLDTFAATQKSENATNISTPMPTTDPIYADDETKPLTYKKGYNFAGWVKVKGSLGDMFTAYNTYEEFQAEQVKPEEITPGTSLMAAYVKNSTCDVGTGSRYYVVTDTQYTRYGAAAATTGNYSIKLTVERKNRAENGVTRLRQPALRVTMTPDVAGAASVFSLIYLDNKDIAEVEIVPAKGIKTVLYTLIDAYGVANWTAASTVMSNVTLSKNTNGVRGTPGFVRDGTVGFINEQGILQNQLQAAENPSSNTGWTGQTNFVAFQDAGLTYEDKEITSAAIANTVKPFILKALTDNHNQPLTHEQIQWAIDHKGELKPVGGSEDSGS